MSTCASDQQNQFKNVRKASEGNINNEEKININAQQSATVTHYSSILEEQIRKLRQ